MSYPVHTLQPSSSSLSLPLQSTFSSNLDPITTSSNLASVPIIAHDFTLTALSSPSTSVIPRFSSCYVASATIQTLSLACVPDQHTRRCLSLPLSVSGERQAWLATCLQVPGSSINVMHRVMWDSGAAINVLSESIYITLGSPSVTPCHDMSVRAVTGNSQRIIGIVRLEVHLCACSHFLADFHVTNVPDTVLISFPQLRALDATIGNILRVPWSSLTRTPNSEKPSDIELAAIPYSSSSSSALLAESKSSSNLATNSLYSVSTTSSSASLAESKSSSNLATNSLCSVSTTSICSSAGSNSNTASSMTSSPMLTAVSTSSICSSACSNLNTASSMTSSSTLTAAAAAPAFTSKDGLTVVRNVDSIRIPPRCEVWIKVQVPAGLLEFNPFTLTSGLYIAKGLFHNGTIEYAESPPTAVPPAKPICTGYVLVMNPTYQYQHLSPQQKIGFVTFLSTEHVVDTVNLCTDHTGSVANHVGLLDINDEDSELVPNPNGADHTSTLSLHDAILKASQKPHLTDEQRKALHHLLFNPKYSHLFSDGSTFPRPSKLAPVEFPTTDDTPVTAKPYRINPELQITMREQLTRMQAQGVVQAHISSPYASPVLLVKKKSGEYRFCVDYRQLNTKLRNDVYPLPVINDVTDALGGATIFTHLDLASGYWQIPIAEKDRHKTAFILPNGLYQFTVLPFGISTAPSIFQRAMDFVLSGLKYEKCLVYIDDIIIYSKDFEQHMKDIEMVLDRLNSFDMTVKITKCDFAAPSLEFLGHELDKDGIRPSTSHVKDIMNWPRPTTVAEVQKFLGLAGYFRKFVKDFSAIAAPLHTLTHGGRPNDVVAWEDEHEQAFRKLRTTLISSPILQYPHFNTPFVVCTDASDIAAGATLEQADSTGLRHVVAYYSERFNEAERRYATCERECLALVKAILHWQHYLSYKPFRVITDHKPLVGTFTPSNKMGENRLTRWKRSLQPFTFTIEYRAGRDNAAPDALSRHPIHFLEKSTEPIAAMEWVNAVTAPPSVESWKELEHKGDTAEMSKWLKEIVELQRKDKELKAVFAYLEEGRVPLNSLLHEKTMQIAMLCKLHNKLLFLRTPSMVDPNKMDKLRLVIPRGYRNAMLKMAHASHLGVKPTYDNLARRFWWKGMWRDVNIYCMNCRACQVSKKPHLKPAGAPGHSSGIAGPMEHIGIDIVGPLKMTKRGNQYFFSFTDYFTGWIEVYPTSTNDTKATASCLSKWIREHGAPIKITTDRGANFITETIHELCELWHISHELTSSYRPESDGRSERSNQIIENAMRAMLEDHPDTEWDDLEDEICFLLHTSLLANGVPSVVLTGFQQRGFLEAELEAVVNKRDYTKLLDTDWIHKHASNLFKARQALQKVMSDRQKKYMDNYNKKRREVHYKNGDLVWMHAMVDDQYGKLGPRMLGPFRVVSASSSTYHLEDLRGKKWAHPIHVSHLQACNLNMPDFDSPDYDTLADDDSPDESSSSSSSTSSSSTTSSSSPFSSFYHHFFFS